MWCGMLEAQVIFRGQLVTMRIKGTNTILGDAELGRCCTLCTLYSVNAILGVCLYSLSTHDPDMERSRGMN
jgi:hypothetical protein